MGRLLERRPAKMAVLFKSSGAALHVCSSLTRSVSNISKKRNFFTQSPVLSVNNLVAKFSKRSPSRALCEVAGADYKQHRDGNNKFFGMLFIPVGLKSLLGSNEEQTETPEEVLTKHIKKSILLIQKGELRQAERLLHVALKLAQEQQNQDGITYVYDVLANLAFDMEEYSKSEKLFVSVLQRLLSSGLAQDHVKVIHISLKLAKVYESTRDFQKCEQGFHFCIDTLKKKIDAGEKDEDTLLLFAMTLDWYARYLIQVNRAEEAVQHLKTAYNVAVEVSGHNNEQTVVLLNDLGTASSIAGDQESAADYLERAINIAKGLEETPEIASIMVNLGVVHMRKGTYEEAKHWCGTARKQATKENSTESYKEGEECLEELRKILTGSSKS